MWDTYFSAKGTWVFENSNEKMANRIPKTTIKCYRDNDLCIEATADIASGQLMVTLEEFQIERWDKYEIVTKPYDYECVRYVLRINRQQRSVKKLRTILSSKDICKGLEVEDKYIRLINGFDEWWQLKTEMNKKRAKVFSPSFNKLLGKLVK